MEGTSRGHGLQPSAHGRANAHPHLSLSLSKWRSHWAGCRSIPFSTAVPSATSTASFWRHEGQSCTQDPRHWHSTTQTTSAQLQNIGTGEVTQGRARPDGSVPTHENALRDEKPGALFQEKGCSTALGPHGPHRYHWRNPHHRFKITVFTAYTQGQYLITFQMVTMKFFGCFQDKQFGFCFL